MRVTTTFVLVATVAVLALTERAQADSAPQIPIAEVPDPSGPNVACHGNHGEHLDVRETIRWGV